MSFETQLKNIAQSVADDLSTELSDAFTDLGRELIADGETTASTIRARFDALAETHGLRFTEGDTLAEEFLEEVQHPDGEEFSVTFVPNILGLD